MTRRRQHKEVCVDCPHRVVPPACPRAICLVPSFSERVCWRSWAAWLPAQLPAAHVGPGLLAPKTPGVLVPCGEGTGPGKPNRIRGMLLPVAQPFRVYQVFPYPVLWFSSHDSPGRCKGSGKLRSRELVTCPGARGSWGGLSLLLCGMRASWEGGPGAGLSQWKKVPHWP